MEALVIEKTRYSPKVVLDKTNQTFEISGNAVPEDGLTFFTPIFAWFKEYLVEPLEETELHFKLNYISSSSLRSIINLLHQLKSLEEQQKSLKVSWFYEEDDDDILTIGHNLSSILSLDINVQPYLQSK